MKSILIRAAVLTAAVSAHAGAMADVTLNFAVEPPVNEVVVNGLSINDMLLPRGAEQTLLTDTVSLDGPSVSFPLFKEPARYMLSFPSEAGEPFCSFYAAPGETLTVAVESLAPAVSVVKGSPLMDGITLIGERLAPLEEEAALVRAGELPAEKMEEIRERYSDLLLGYIRENPSSPAAVYALLSLDGDRFAEGDSLLGEEVRTSILYPFLEPAREENARRKALSDKRARLQSGAEAPEIALRNADGDVVRLSDFRGKWVIIDFWGSWCGWCVKGFPALKECYEQNKERLMVFGVDCGDTDKAWRDAVARFGLPWTNVYLPADDKSVLSDYAVEGFPTKVIVNPEGRVVEIVTGEQPSFYERLRVLMSE